MIRCRTILATLGAVALLAATVTSAFAWPERVEGANNPEPGDPVGYYIWHNDGGWHLRTHGPGDDHHLTARLRTDGEFDNVDTVRLESRDDYTVLDGGHVLRLDFHTYNWTDGVNFNVHGGTSLRFDLELDDAQIAVDSIYLGRDGRHPRSNPFILRR
jgi:hypothetical protein